MRFAAIAVLISGVLVGGARGDDASPSLAACCSATEKEQQEGFQSIFDGKTLDGWRDTAGYVAEDGMLVCQKEGGNIFTKAEFGDMIFRFEFRLEPGGNNGVSVRGHEIQILDDDAPKHKNLKPYQYHGSIYTVYPAERGHTKPAGQWNSEEITLRGSRWKVVVNGAVVVDVDLAQIPGQEQLAARVKGPIGFRGHNNRVEFRNLRVKPL